MRQRESNDLLSVHAISGTHVVMLGLDATEDALDGLLGFTIRRSGGGRDATLGGGLVFKGVAAETTETTPGSTPARGAEPPAHPPSVRSDEAPIQAFLWSDYTAVPGTDYTYEVVPVYGAAGALEPRDGVSVSVRTETPDDGVHGVFFNRGVAGSQAYARLFGEHRRSYRIGGNEWQSFIRPEDVPDRKAYEWLSRGLEEAMLAFIGQADGPEYTLHASVYEFSHLPVIRAFVAALESGAEVKIVHHCKKTKALAIKRDFDSNVVVKSDPRDGQGPPADDVVYTNKTIVEVPAQDDVGAATDRAVRAAGLTDASNQLAFDRMLIERSVPPISHNKFIVLLKDGKPVQVWTGSTNYTDGGIFGQSNVGHVIRDEATAEAYHAYWEQLKENPDNATLKAWTVAQGTALAAGVEIPPDSITPVFSPRSDQGALDWYGEQIGNAKQSVHLTSAFTISDQFLDELVKEDPPGHPYQRYVLLEGIGGLLRDKSKAIRKVPLNRVAWGEILKARGEKEELVESLTGLNSHVNYLHTKYMLIDPLSDDPIVITGSANFSKASTVSNDENMVVIRGDTRVADIFLGEFMRLFNHYLIRNELNALDDLAFDARQYLAGDDSWTVPYFDGTSELCHERLLFR